MSNVQFRDPETGEVLECCGDIVTKPGRGEQQRTHGPTPIEVRNPPSLNGERFYCPVCEWFLDQFMGVDVKDVV